MRFSLTTSGCAEVLLWPLWGDLHASGVLRSEGQPGPWMPSSHSPSPVEMQRTLLAVAPPLPRVCYGSAGPGAIILPLGFLGGFSD